MKIFNPSAYKITIQQAEVDGENVFVGTVAEFPDLAVYEDSFSEAYEAITSVIESLRTSFAENNQDFPEPNPELPQQWSGRVTLRIPKSIHMRVASLAEQEGVSLNHFLTSIISREVGVKFLPKAMLKTDVVKQVTTSSVATYFGNASEFWKTGTRPFEPGQFFVLNVGANDASLEKSSVVSHESTEARFIQ